MTGRTDRKFTSESTGEGPHSRRDWIQWARRILSAAAIPTPRLDAEMLLAYCLKMERIRLHIDPDVPVAPKAAEQFATLIGRREMGDPVAYLTGHREFFGMDFLVTPEVLIPRPETEQLVEIVLAWIRTFPGHALRAADVGTGSGCIAVSMAASVPTLQITAVDASEKALEVARANCERHQVTGQVRLVHGQWLDPLQGAALHLVVSNPPYISREELQTLPASVAGFEPVDALDGGEDGLNGYRHLVPQASRILVPGGLLAVETGSQQGCAVAWLLEQSGFQRVQVHQDLAGWDRVVTGEQPLVKP